MMGADINNHETVKFLHQPHVHPRVGVRKHYVYEMYADDGTCLYVGFTGRLEARLGAHMAKPWWHAVTRIEVAVFPDFEAASQAERAQILVRKPTHNEQFIDGAAATRQANREARHALGELCPPKSRCLVCREQRSWNGGTPLDTKAMS